MSEKEVSSGSGRTENVDDLLDEIDEVLENNADEFVRAFVSKGGQGESDYLSPQFFAAITAIATAVVEGAAYDLLKGAFQGSVRALRKELPQHPDTRVRPILTEDRVLPEGSIWDLTNPDGSFRDQRDEELLKAYVEFVSGILGDAPPRHQMQEADALHAVLFTRDLLARAGWVQLPAKQAKALYAAGRRRKGAELTAAQMAAEIVGAWMDRNPRAAKGDFEL